MHKWLCGIVVIDGIWKKNTTQCAGAVKNKLCIKKTCLGICRVLCSSIKCGGAFAKWSPKKLKKNHKKPCTCKKNSTSKTNNIFELSHVGRSYLQVNVQLALKTSEYSNIQPPFPPPICPHPNPSYAWLGRPKKVWSALHFITTPHIPCPSPTVLMWTPSPKSGENHTWAHPLLCYVP